MKIVTKFSNMRMLSKFFAVTGSITKCDKKNSPTLFINYYLDTSETQIHIQTQIRKTFILALATNDLLYLLLKYRKELPTTKLLTEKQVSKSLSLCR